MVVRRRVSFVLGTWQLTVLCACLDQRDAESSDAVDDHLVFYGPGLPDDMKRAMAALAEASDRTWASVTWADDLLLKPERPGGRDRGLVAALRERIGLPTCDEIWVCKLYDFAEKVILEAFPRARVQLYEDGMHFYVDQPVVRGRPLDWAGAVRSVPRRVRAGDDRQAGPVVDVGHVGPARLAVAGMWVVSSPSMRMPVQDLGPRVHVEPTRLRTAVQRIATVAKLDECRPQGDRPVAVVLGQAFARFGLMTAGAESNLYISVCAQLLNDGFEVLWKDHPRLHEGYGGKILSALGSTGPLSTLPLTSEWPVEAAIERIRPAALVSGTSTSLFVCASLFDTPGFTFAGSLRLPLIRADHRRMAALVCRTFPPPRLARWSAGARSQPVTAA